MYLSISLVIQMGSWLLIKEACATLASMMTYYPGPGRPGPGPGPGPAVPAVRSLPPLDLIQMAGSLLIHTLTSLKHKGGLFAAHKALHVLCVICYSSHGHDDDHHQYQSKQLRSLPATWAHKLIQEILSIEIVRDSTLRRSTGYVWTFLSIMRPEPAPFLLFTKIIAVVIKLSLPSGSYMKNLLQECGFVNAGHVFAFCNKGIDDDNNDNDAFVKDEEYQSRVRVHALHILHLVILDAPLATQVKPFVGDAIISVLIGHTDCDDSDDWAIRNAATLTFAAALLRVINADRNAGSACDSALRGEIAVVSSKEEQRGTANVITAKELFRNYPALPQIMLSMIAKETTSSSSLSSSNNSTTSTLHNNSSTSTTLFPILMLLSKLQPASLSSRADADADTADTADTDTNNSIGVTNNDNNSLLRFIDPVFQCLSHPHHKVRVMASQAITVLCTGDGYGDDDYSVENGTNNWCSSQASQLSRPMLLERCCKGLILFMDLPPSDHHRTRPRHKHKHKHNYNGIHGGLLAIQTLLQTSPNPCLYFKGSLLNTIVHFATSWSSVSVGKCQFDCPPPCVDVALDIWVHVNRKSNGYFQSVVVPPGLGLGKDDQSKSKINITLMDTAYKIVLHSEKLLLHHESRSRHHVTTDVIGLAGLASVAAQTVCEISFQIVYDYSQFEVESSTTYTTSTTTTTSRQKQKRQLYLRIIEKLFCSNCMDVKIHAVKVYKKFLSRVIDDFVITNKFTNNKFITDNDNSMGVRQEVISDSCHMVMSSLIHEIRLQTTCPGCPGPHPPTLRRLSRCALELFSAYKYLNKQHLHIISTFDDHVCGGGGQQHELWGYICRLIRRRNNYRSATSTTYNSCHDNKVQVQQQTMKKYVWSTNVLSGNALELLSLFLSEELTLSSVGNGNGNGRCL